MRWCIIIRAWVSRTLRHSPSESQRRACVPSARGRRRHTDGWRSCPMSATDRWVSPRPSSARPHWRIDARAAAAPTATRARDPHTLSRAVALVDKPNARTAARPTRKRTAGGEPGRAALGRPDRELALQARAQGAAGVRDRLPQVARQARGQGVRDRDRRRLPRPLDRRQPARRDRRRQRAQPGRGSAHTRRAPPRRPAAPPPPPPRRPVFFFVVAPSPSRSERAAPSRRAWCASSSMSDESVERSRDNTRGGRGGFHHHDGGVQPPPSTHRSARRRAGGRRRVKQAARAPRVPSGFRAQG